MTSSLVNMSCEEQIKEPQELRGHGLLHLQTAAKAIKLISALLWGKL